MTSSASSADLDAQQTEILVMFQAVTGRDSFEECRQILEWNNWDVEAAVRSTLGIRDDVHAHVPQQRPASAATTGARRSQVQRHNNVNNNNIGWLSWIIVLPLRIASSVVSGGLGVIGRYLPTSVTTIISYAVGAVADDPVADATRLERDLERKYGGRPPRAIIGSYRQAIDRAKQDLSFLLVYLHSEEHEDTPKFCRSTLCTEELVRFADQQNIPFWCGSLDTPEGLRAQEVLNASSFPYMALVVQVGSRCSVVDTFEGPVALDAIITRITRAMDIHGTVLAEARADRAERTMSQRIREEQDEAYLESLRQDQEKEQRRIRELERQREEEEAARSLELRAQQDKEERARQRKLKLARLPAEPTDDTLAARILVKLPNGARLDRKFPKTATVQDVYDYVDGNEIGVDRFILMTNYPRMVLQDMGKTLEAAGVLQGPPSKLQQGMLFVQNAEDDDE
eukprot:Opistho-2@60994